MNKRNFLTLFAVCFGAFLILGVFLFGFASGRYPTFPLHHEVLAAKDALLGRGSFIQKQFRKKALGSKVRDDLFAYPESIWFQDYFTMVFDKTYPPLYEPIRSFKDLKETIEKTGVYDTPPEAFYSAYKDAFGFSEENYLNNGSDIIKKLSFDLPSGAIESYSILIKSKSTNSDCAILWIPGSGQNIATVAVKGDQEFYKDSARVMSEFCDVYVQVKPFEDFRAIHDGTKKAAYKGLTAPAIVYGGSYSTRYIIESIGWSKYLQSKYSKYGVAGLSQGGTAAMIVSLEVTPDFSIPASGFTVSFYDTNYYSTTDGNVNIPNYFRVYTKDKIAKILSSSPTHFQLMYGLNEFHGMFAYEAKTRASCNFLAEHTSKIDCAIHDGGHQFSNPDLRRFLMKVTTE